MKLSVKAAKEMGIPVPPRNRKRQEIKYGGDGPKTKHAGLSPAQKAFMALCLAHGLPEPVEEFQFHPERKWRFDWIFEGLVAVEQTGGVWTKGHHSGGQDQIDDMEKRNEAQIMGYLVLEFTPQQLSDGSALPIIRRALEARGEQS